MISPKARTGRRFVFHKKARRLHIGPALPKGIKMGQLMDLGFFVCLENPDTGQETYSDTPAMIRQALALYGARFWELDTGTQQHYLDLKATYEAVYGPWPSRDTEEVRRDH